MTTALMTLAAIFAVYRVSFMITREEGPFDVFERIRTIAQQLPSEADIQSNRRRLHWVARGIACPLCISFWFSLPAAYIVTQVSDIPAIATFGLWLSIAGGCLFLFQVGGT